MKIIFTQELVAPCGMNCNVCSGYLALRYEIKTKGFACRIASDVDRGIRNVHF